jgi:translation initiation factor 2 beta subunit (eIF-2beta)/eIF-5
MTVRRSSVVTLQIQVTELGLPMSSDFVTLHLPRSTAAGLHLESYRETLKNSYSEHEQTRYVTFFDKSQYCSILLAGAKITIIISKTLLIIQTDVHYYKIVETLIQFLKNYNTCSDMFRFTQEPSSRSSPVLR